LTEKEGLLGTDGQRIGHLEQLLTASEHDRKLIEERLEHARLGAEDLKKKQATLNERLTHKQRGHEDLDLKRQELEGIIKHLNADMEVRKQTEDQLRNRVTKLTDERKSLAERVTGLQRAVTQLASEKQQEHKDFKRSLKENSKLKKNIDDIEKDKLQSDEVLQRLNAEKGNIEHQFLTSRQDIKDARDQIKKLELALTSTEQMYERRLADSSERFRRDMDIELERARVTNIQADRALGAKERAQVQRITHLEDTCQDLREQVNRANRQTRRKHRQTAELLADIRRSTSPMRNASPSRSPTRY